MLNLLKRIVSAIRLVDFKIEIGRIWDGDFMRLVVADEISPDSCRLWDVKTGEKLDKDVFRRDLGDLSDTYREVYRRVFGAELLLVGVLDLTAGMYDVYAETLQPLDLKDQLEVNTGWTCIRDNSSDDTTCEDYCPVSPPE